MTTTLINLCLCSDRNAVDGLVGVLATASRRLATGYRIKAHVVDFGIGPELTERLRAVVAAGLPRVELVFVTPRAEQMAGFSPMTGLKHMTIAGYGRLLLHELWPELDDAIYLDCDLFIQADLASLARIDIGPCPIGAVQDTTVLTLGSNWSTLTQQLPHLPAMAPYFNSGVLRLNLRRLREIDATAKFVEMAKTLTTYYADQSILNAVFAEQWHPLPAGYNRQVFLLPTFNLFSDQPMAIWHFIRENKPWHFAAAGSRGLVGEWHRELRSIGWTPVVKPRLIVQSSPWRDAVKASAAALRRQ